MTAKPTGPTPGPYTVDLSSAQGPFACVISGGGKIIAWVRADVASGDWKDEEHGARPENAESVATAYLLASAPKMRDVLETLSSIFSGIDEGYLSPEEFTDEILQELRDVIESARPPS